MSNVNAFLANTLRTEAGDLRRHLHDVVDQATRALAAMDEGERVGDNPLRSAPFVGRSAAKVEALMLLAGTKVLPMRDVMDALQGDGTEARRPLEVDEPA